MGGQVSPFAQAQAIGAGAGMKRASEALPKPGPKAAQDRHFLVSEGREFIDMTAYCA